MPDASCFVRFNCSSIGKIVGTGSDVSDHSPVNLPERQMRVGLISIAIKLSSNEGTLRLSATTDNLDSASIGVEIMK